MVALQVEKYSSRLKMALHDHDLNAVQQISEEADRYLRRNLPLPSNSEEDLNSLVSKLEVLSEQYQLAVSVVEAAKHQANQELNTLNKSHQNTNKYLDVARHIGE